MAVDQTAIFIETATGKISLATSHRKEYFRGFVMKFKYCEPCHQS